MLPWQSLLWNSILYSLLHSESGLSSLWKEWDKNLKMVKMVKFPNRATKLTIQIFNIFHHDLLPVRVGSVFTALLVIRLNTLSVLKSKNERKKLEYLSNECLSWDEHRMGDLLSDTQLFKHLTVFVYQQFT